MICDVGDGCGILEISFVPESGLRSLVSLNSRYASIVSTISQEDVLNAHAQNRFNLNYPHLDLLFLLADDILLDFRDRVRYFRLMKLCDRMFNPILVCCAVSREFDGLGRLCKVFIWALADV